MLVFKEKKFLHGYCVSAMKDATTVVVVGYPRNASLNKEGHFMLLNSWFFPQTQNSDLKTQPEY